MENSVNDVPQPETLFAAALYLATKYARTGCPLLCRMVMWQLACIEHHSNQAVPRSMRETCKKLSAEWERIGVERARALDEGALEHGSDAQQVH